MTTESAPGTLPSRADVVIVGGGIMGVQRRLSPGSSGCERCRPRGAEPAHRRGDLARSRARRTAQVDAEHDRDRQVFVRALCPSRGGDRPGDRVHGDGVSVRCRQPRALRGVAARCFDGEDCRPRGDRAHSWRGRGTVAADADRRLGWCGPFAGRRALQSGRYNRCAGEGRQRALASRCSRTRGRSM